MAGKIPKEDWQLEGDEEEFFEGLFDRYYRPVSRFFAKRGISKDECLDLTQDTFLGVHRGISRFRRSDDVEKWLFTIAANVWRNRCRGQSTQKRSALVLSLESGAVDTSVISAQGSSPPTPEANALSDERIQLLRRAVAELPPQMRRCVFLRIDQDLKYREIADLLCISIDTVKSLLGQAKKRLKEKLVGDFEGFDL